MIEEKKYPSDKFKFPNVPIIIKVKNTNDIKSNAILFGSDKFLTIENFGSDKGVEIKGNGLDYVQVIQSDFFNETPFKKLLIQSSNSSQVSKELEYSVQDVSGSKVEYSIKPQYDPMQMQSGVISVSFSNVIFFSKNSWVKFDIEPKTEVVFTFYPYTNFTPTKSEKLEITKKNNWLKTTYNKIKFFFKSKK